jgi:hypothetical protein
MTVNYGTDVSNTLRTVALTFPDGTTRAVTAVQHALAQDETSGRALLIEAIVRRLVTYRGTLIDTNVPSETADYGNDVTQNVNADFSPREIAMAAAAVDAELRKDERVIRSSTVATLVGDVLILAITVTDGIGPFKLTLAVRDVISLLSVPQ